MIRTKYVAAVIWLAALYIGGCVLLGSCTSTGDPDWPRISTELELGAHDMRDLATITEDEALVEILVQTATAMEDAALFADHPPVGTVEMIEPGLALADTLVEQLDEEDQDDARVVLMLARAILRRYVAYLPTDTE